VSRVDTVTEDIQIDGRLTVVTRPRADGPWAGVVMIHEAWGIDDVLRRHAQRLAAVGYVVLAPDLIGEGSWMACVRRAMRAMAARQGRPFEVVEACRAWLREDPGCSGKIGVIGFCMGGGFALVLGPRGFDVSAVNYGPVPDDLADAIKGSCPVVASYGGKDKQLAVKAPVLEAELEAQGIPHDVLVYPSAGHSFLNDAVNGPLLFRPLMRIVGVGPEPVAAGDAWRRIEAFFATYLHADHAADGPVD
jgi:carboxymethylenebutenolidase